MFTIEYSGEGNGIRAIFSFNPPVEEREHIIDKEGIGKVVNTDGGVLLGKMSFQMTADVFDATWFNLVATEDTSPRTGIKINIDGTHYYEEQSTFRFTDETASKDSSLSNLIVSTGEIDKTEPDKSTYKEYEYTPTFNKETFNYELKLYEYIDTMDIKAITTDSNATMKIKVPKRNENNKLVYDTDGTTIIYEEKDIESNAPFKLTLNKLGESDTAITIITTAEDTKTQSNYELVIKRPYGTIKGSVQLGENLRKSTELTYGIDLDYLSDIKIYKYKDINWEELLNGLISFDDFDLINPQTQGISNKEDGSYELFVIPGVYDTYMETKGFTQCVVTQINVKENEIVDIGSNILYEGDVVRDGVIDLNDLTMEGDLLRSQVGDGKYQEYYDFHKKGMVNLDDLTCVSTNLKARKTMIIK